MAKIRNMSGENLTVPDLGGRLVLEGGVVDCPDDLVYGFTCQSIWEPADGAAEELHAAGEAKYAPADVEHEEPEELDLEKATVAQLKKYAAAHEIELDGAKTKAQILAAIEASSDHNGEGDPEPDPADGEGPDANDNHPED